MRIRFADELGDRGELDLTEVRVGDLVRFETEWEDPESTAQVEEGAVGEVLKVRPQAPTLTVQVLSTELRRGGRFSQGFEEFAVSPEAVTLELDSRDPRISDR